MPAAFSLIKGWEGAGRGVHCTETTDVSLSRSQCCGDAVSLTTRLKGGQESNEGHDPLHGTETSGNFLSLVKIYMQWPLKPSTLSFLYMKLALLS